MSLMAEARANRKSLNPQSNFPSTVSTPSPRFCAHPVMVGLGMTLLGGEAYITFKPDLVDADGNIGDESTRKFLQGFLDKFASLLVQLSPQDTHSAA